LTVQGKKYPFLVVYLSGLGHSNKFGKISLSAPALHFRSIIG